LHQIIASSCFCEISTVYLEDTWSILEFNQPKEGIWVSNFRDPFEDDGASAEGTGYYAWRWCEKALKGLSR
jgi:hypothetical protein